MSTDTLEFPPIDTAPRADVATVDAAAQDLAKIDLQAVALAQFNAAHADAAKAKATLTGVVHDLSTPTKLADAKSLRHRLINTPLAEARKVSAGLKSKLTAVSKAVGAELVAIEGRFEEADKLITPQIEKREAELAEERRIAAEKEAARVQAHRDALAKLAAPAERAALPEMTAERIANGIAAVEAIVIDRAAWEDFADRAEEQKSVTLERMRKLHADALADEERARIAAELKAEQDRLAAERAEIERQRAELQDQRDAAAAAERARAEEAARLEREQREEAERQARELQVARERAEAAEAKQNSEAQESQQVLKAEPATADATDPGTPAIASPSVGSMGAGQAADAAPSVGFARGGYIPFGASRIAAEPAAEVPMLKLGELWTILGLDDREAFLAGIGFPATPAAKGTAKLYRESDLQAIYRAASKRFADLAVAAEQQKAA